MDGPGRVWNQLAGLSVLNFLVFYPLQEFLDWALDLVSLAELHVLSAVSDPHILLESDVLMQLKEEAAAKFDILDAVQRSHWLALELLLNAVGIGEVEHVEIGPEGALVQEDATHLLSPGLVGGRPHLLAEELQGRSADIAGEEVLIDRRVEVLVDVVKRLPVLCCEVPGQLTAQVLVRIDDLVESGEVINVSLKRRNQLECLRQSLNGGLL